MDIKLLYENLNDLTSLLDSFEMSNEEKEYRKNNLWRGYEDSIVIVDNKYYDFSHETRSIVFLNKISSNVVISSDSKSEVGCDITMDNIYKIECVCCHQGDTKINELCDYLVVNKIVDGKKKEDIVLSRITQAIEEKKKKYHDYKEKGILLDSDVFIIFIGLGELSYYQSFGENSIDFNKVLFGADQISYTIDLKRETIIDAGYTQRKKMIVCKTKDNIDREVSINCNLFSDNNYSFISGIILSTAELNESYTFENTIMFINPLAKNKIDISNFGNIRYWCEEKDMS